MSYATTKQFELKPPGVLYVVATPIGNLDDITLRAINVLKSVDKIAAEDTRHSQVLMTHIDVNTPLTAYHEHNAESKGAHLVSMMEAGQSIALISDAGTPLISDPGYRLVLAAKQAGIVVAPIPGACAAIAALSVAGLPSDRFVFEGFLPAKRTARQKRLAALKAETSTLITYESPRRIVDFVADIVEVMGATRELVLCRELTKTFETIYVAPAEDMHAWIKADSNQQRGEIVLLIKGAGDVEEDALGLDLTTLLSALSAELPLTKAAKVAAKVSGRNKQDLYEMLLAQNK